METAKITLAIPLVVKKARFTWDKSPFPIIQCWNTKSRMKLVDPKYKK